MIKMSSDNYGVIGVGAFGEAVARTLARSGKNVIAVDVDQEKLKTLSDEVSEVYKIEVLNRESLEEAGLGSCSTVIIGIGENVEASILAALDCIEIGIPNVISKAGTKEHGKILEKIGATVIYPEEESGERIARKLMSHVNLDILPLSEDFSIISLDVNPSFVGKSILNLNWRQKYGVNVIAVINDGKSDAAIGPDTIIHSKCRVVISGNNKALDKFREVNSKGL